MPELPEVQAHAERLTEQFAGAVLTRVRAARVHRAEDRDAADPTTAYGEPLQRGRPPRQVPAARVRAGDVRRPPDAGRSAARRRQAVGQAAERSGPVRCSTTDAALLLTEAGKEQRGRRVGASPPATRLDAPTRSTGSDPRPTRSTADELAQRLLPRAQHAPPRVPARPARDRRPRSDARQRDLPPGQALAVRDDRQARPPTTIARPCDAASTQRVDDGLAYERTPATT